jgi:putative transposase
MHLIPDEYYHIYNRGNNKQLVFFNHANYLFFIQKIRDQILPVADMIAYCLMPNHFHFIIHSNENSIQERKSFGGKPMQEFTYRLGILLSSYSQAINKQNNTSGSLFQQKTKAKILIEETEERRISYLENCFFYVHQNPKEAGVVKNLIDWPYSSYLDYTGIRNGSLCNKELFFMQTGLSIEAIKGWTDWDLSDDLINKLY